MFDAGDNCTFVSIGICVIKLRTTARLSVIERKRTGGRDAVATYGIKLRIKVVANLNQSDDKAGKRPDANIFLLASAPRSPHAAALPRPALALPAACY